MLKRKKTCQEEILAAGWIFPVELFILIASVCKGAYFKLVCSCKRLTIALAQVKDTYLFTNISLDEFYDYLVRSTPTHATHIAILQQMATENAVMCSIINMRQNKYHLRVEKLAERLYTFGPSDGIKTERIAGTFTITKDALIPLFGILDPLTHLRVVSKRFGGYTNKYFDVYKKQYLYGLM